MACQYCKVTLNDTLIKGAIYSGLNYATTVSKKSTKGGKIKNLIFERVSRKKLGMEIVVDFIIYILIDYNYEKIVKMSGFKVPEGKTLGVCTCQLFKDAITATVIELYSVFMMRQAFSASALLRQFIIMGGSDWIDNMIRKKMPMGGMPRTANLPTSNDEVIDIDHPADDYNITPSYSYL